MNIDDKNHEALRRQIQVRREVIEQTLARMDPQVENNLRDALESKLRDLEALLGEGNWEHLPAHVLDELRAWLDEPILTEEHGK